MAQMMRRQHVVRLECIVLVEVVLKPVHLGPSLDLPGAVAAEPALLAQARPAINTAPVP